MKRYLIGCCVLLMSMTCFGQTNEIQPICRPLATGGTTCDTVSISGRSGIWEDITTPPKCITGEYLTVDGRCLHDRTGEGFKALDGCNWCTCMDANCRVSSCTLMARLHGDDPASIQPLHEQKEK
jgi:hypothetical protein